MNAHTGFLIFCRHQERSADFEYSRPLGTRQRKQEAARQARLAESGANPYDDGETAGDDESFPQRFFEREGEGRFL